MPRILESFALRMSSSALLTALIGLCSLAPRSSSADSQDPPKGVDPGWLSRAEAQILAGEYEFSQLKPGAVMAPNRAQDLRTRVTAAGIEFTPRLPADRPFHLALTLAAFGREGAPRPVLGGTVGADRGRATLAHGRAAITEWVENRPEGVEQGFTLAERPHGGGSGTMTIVSLAVAGDLRALSGRDPRQIEFADGTGRVRLFYGDLRATDSRGRPVPASFALAHHRIDIRLDDRGVQYPITVDPITTGETWSDGGRSGAYGYFGWSVSTAGDVNGDGYSDVVIGAPFDDHNGGDAGAVFVYFGSSSGLPANPSWIFYPGAPAAQAGTTVACAGDVNGDGYDDLLVGETGGGSYGYVFLFLGDHAGFKKAKNSVTADWSFQAPGATLHPSIATAGDLNGDGLADILVGTPNEGLSNEGVVRIWLGRSGFGTTFTTGTTSNSDWSGDGSYLNAQFGYSVSTAGDVNGDGYSDVLIGVPHGGPAGQGEFILMLGSGSSSPPVTGYYDFTGITVGSLTGYSVATTGDVNGDGYSDVIVGFPGYSGSGYSGGGGAWVLLGRSTAPYLGAGGTLTGTAVGDSMGICVATAGDVNGDGYADVLIGSGKLPSPALAYTPRGHAELYLGSATGLRLIPAWSRTGGVDNIGDGELFGMCVATAGDVDGDGFSDFLVSAPASGPSRGGRVYLFKGSANLPGQQPVWSNSGGSNTEFFGWSVSSAGDVNADGYSDVIVGSPLYDNGQTDEGRVLVYYGSSAGLPTTPSWSYESNSAGANLGISVASAGDLNGDGYGDIIVGAHEISANLFSHNGAAFVWYGSSAGLPNAAPAWAAYGGKNDAHFGSSVAGAGDVNGDGYADVVIGAPNDSLTQTGEGAAYAWYGSAGGLVAGPANWSAHSNQAGAEMGNAVSGAGDVNGDGFSDVIVGAPLFDESISGTTYADAGRAFLYRGWGNGLSSSPIQILSGGTESGSQFGCSVADAGDVNGDGYSDVLVGQVWYTGSGPASQGRALLYMGSSSGIPATPSWTVSSGQSGAAFGSSVAGAGDVNGDGFSDVLVGAEFYDDGMTDGGEAFLYYGGPGGPGTGASWTAKLTQNYANLAASVAGAGDVNGDGFADIILGAPGYDAGAIANAGLAEVFYGNASGTGLTAGLARPIEQKGDCFLCVPPPIYTMDLSSGQNFIIDSHARSAAGRDHVRMQWEVKGNALPLNGTSIQDGGTALMAAPAGGGSAADVAQIGNCPYGSSPCHWRLRTASHNPFFPRSTWVSLPANAPDEADIRTQVATVAVGPEGESNSLALAGSYPNPAKSLSHVRFSMAHAGHARLTVLDVAGRKVRTLADGSFEAGEHSLEWNGLTDDGQSSPAGIYFYRLEVEGHTFSKEMTRVR